MHVMEQIYLVNYHFNNFSQLDHIVDIIGKYNNDILENAEAHIVICDLDVCIMMVCFQFWDAGITEKWDR